MTISRDIAASVQYRERPSLSQMRQRIRDGEIQSVVVTTIDRLSRNQVHLKTLMAEMGHHNITLFTTEVKLENAE